MVRGEGRAEKDLSHGGTSPRGPSHPAARLREVTTNVLDVRIHNIRHKQKCALAGLPGRHPGHRHAGPHLGQARPAARRWEGRDGDLLIVPDAPHSLQALQDSAVLLTVAKRICQCAGHYETGCLSACRVRDGGGGMHGVRPRSQGRAVRGQIDPAGINTRMVLFTAF